MNRSTLSETNQRQRNQPDNGRRAVLLAGLAIGTIAGIIRAAIAWPEIGPVAYAGIVAVGSITGAALGVLAAIVRKSPSS